MFLLYSLFFICFISKCLRQSFRVLKPFAILSLPFLLRKWYYNLQRTVLALKYNEAGDERQNFIPLKRTNICDENLSAMFKNAKKYEI